MHDDKQFEQIEAYLSNKLSAAATTEFEQEIAKNQSLKQAVNRHKITHRAVEVLVEQKLRQSFKHWDQEQEAKIVGINRGAKVRKILPRLALAMSVTLVLGFGLSWILSGNYSNHNLFVANYQTPTDLTIRGDNRPSEISEGMVAFEQGNYESAIQYFSNVPYGNEYFEQSQYYLGHAHLKAGNPKAASEAFQAAAHGDDGAIKEKAEWHFVLSKLSANEEDQYFNSMLDFIANDEGHSFNIEANRLKKDLNDFFRAIFN